ncbi:MAG: radical SAM protein [Clostridiales bacterium]|nr:radical SAM protein [Clostridiales bacterium]
MEPKRRVIPVFVPHLGCPHDCVFCNQRKISGSIHPADGDTVGKAIEEALEKTGAKENTQLAFYGGSFTAIPVEKQEELLGAALPFLRDGSISSVRISTRPDAINEETLDRLLAFGVKTIELGAQSMCDDVLTASGRGHKARDTEKAAELIKQRDFELILQMMTGLPMDTEEKSLETARKIIALAPNGVRIYPTVIIGDTMLHELWRQGKYKEHTVTAAAELCAKLLPMFNKANIPVIRLGLNPTEELSAGAALAGAYHPAFGEIVLSRIFLDKARSLLKQASVRGDVILGVNPSEVSIMTGQHRCNIKKLCEELSLNSLKIKPWNVNKGEIILL